MHLTAHLDIDLLALAADEELTCLVELTAPTPPEDVERPGQAVVVVLDRSGSMGGGRPGSGSPIEAARAAIVDLMRRLSPQDVFGLVTFDSVVDVVVPVGRMADRRLDDLIAAVAGVDARGTTDLSAGYLMGVREAERALTLGGGAGAAGAGGAAPLSGATVLLLSDGHANAGITDPDRLAEVATQAQRGATPTTTSTLGLGEGYDEVILAALARGGSGEHRFAPDVDAASAEFTGLVDDLLGKSVTGALLRVHPQHGLVDTVRVHGSLPSWQDGGAVVVNLGDLYGGEERRVLVGIGVPGLERLGTATVADLELSYTSLPDLAVHTVTLPVSVNVVPGDEARGRVPDARVSVARLLLEADDAKRVASERLRAGDERAARSSLTEAIAQVRGGREVAGSDPELAERIDAAVTDLEELERTARDRSREEASKLAMESWNQTSRGKQRRRARFIDEGFAVELPGVGGGAGRVLLAQGDIVGFARGGRHDAVVSAANPGLVGGAGVAGALMAAGGQGLVDECRALVAASGPFAVGDAVATGGHGLRVPVVVHAIGPRYGVDVPSDELLAAAHRRAIEVADERGCTAVAMPAISTGIFGYPVDEAAPIALRAVGEALARCTSVEHVTFVLWDDATMDAYRAAAAAV